MKSPFLNKKKIAENNLSFSIYDSFPVSKGHSLIIPKRIVADIFDLNDEEYKSCFDLVKTVKEIIKNKFNPDGFNVGVNSGETAGQTIFHAHIHVIPHNFLEKKIFYNKNKHHPGSLLMLVLKM